MEIVAAGPADWEVFLRLARREGWRVPPQEVALFGDRLAGDALVLREGGAWRGFVTAVAHERTGWIGNLLVPAECRGRGYGTFIFERTLETLRRRGCRSLWLTASELGRPLYEKKGFQLLDGIDRWVLEVSAERREGGAGNAAGEALLEADRLGWGESRRRLLPPLIAGGEVFRYGSSVALLQQGDQSRILGPWYSAQLCPRENRQLLAEALAAAGGAEVVADVRASSPLRPLLTAAGFRCQGSCALMAAGAVAEVDLSAHIALASLGSIG